MRSLLVMAGTILIMYAVAFAKDLGFVPAAITFIVGALIIALRLT